MLTPIEIFFSVIMAVASIFTAVNFYLLFNQRQREIKIHTTDNIDKISMSVSNFWMVSKGINQYTKKTEQWYMEKVEPYLSFLLWLSVKIEYRLFKVKTIQKFNPQLKENYERIEPYIKYQRESDPKAWIEIDELNKKLLKNT